MSQISSGELQRIYAQRFNSSARYRQRVWQVLVKHFFQRWVPASASVLDLGCGYGEFINVIPARRKFGMDLNPETQKHLAPNIEFLRQDCSLPWPNAARDLDVVFTSNFFEHLPDKATLGRTLDEIARALKPGGRLIAMGPNIKFTGGRYWDFWDHFLPLTEASLAEALVTRGLQIEQCFDRFLPFTMSGRREFPMWIIALYLKCPFLWRLKGEQFLVIAAKPHP
jgi:SAM-dependent methyltransferase